MRALLVLSGVMLAPLAAQSVAVSVSAPAPLSLSLVDGAATVQQSYPGGALPAGGGFQVAAIGWPAYVGASMSWQFGADSFRAAANVSTYQVSDLASAVVHAGPMEFVVEFTATSSLPVQLVCSRFTALPAGAPWPTVQLDFGNDGTIDVANLASGDSFFPVISMLGGAPFRVRLLVDAQLPGQGVMQNDLSIRLEPRNDLTVLAAVAGCAATDLIAAPVFADAGLEVLVSAAFPTVLVLGLSPQPILLSMALGLPCLLLPAPDILVFAPTGVVPLALPPAVRPVTFWLQGVSVAPTGFETTAGVRVQAL